MSKTSWISGGGVCVGRQQIIVQNIFFHNNILSFSEDTDSNSESDVELEGELSAESKSEDSDTDIRRRQRWRPVRRTEGTRNSQASPTKNRQGENVIICYCSDYFTI